MSRDDDNSLPNAGKLKGQVDQDGTLGRIALKRVRVTRAEVEGRSDDDPQGANGSTNRMNRLVAYLDLFARLEDEELSRLAQVPRRVVESLRKQIVEVHRALERYVDLLPRLSDDELVRLTGGNPKTIRFWRLSQPRMHKHEAGEAKAPEKSREPTGPQDSQPDGPKGSGRTPTQPPIAVDDVDAAEAERTVITEPARTDAMDKVDRGGASISGSFPVGEGQEPAPLTEELEINMFDDEEDFPLNDEKERNFF